MKSYRSLIGFLVIIFAGQAWASVSEIEPNSPVLGMLILPLEGKDNTEVSTLIGPNNTTGDGLAVDPSLATALPAADEMVAQLSGPRDYDWFYFDVSNPQQQVTPVYFGCDKKFGIYQEGGATGEPYFQVNYYYDADPSSSAGLAQQGSYVVNKEICKRGLADTKGPFRFQINTQRPGRYYVRVWGRLVDVVKKTETRKDANDKDITVTILEDQVLAYTSDYTLRVYNTRVSGEMEPNDGIVEAFLMSAGTSVTGQLSSMFDEDWFYFDNDISSNTSKKIPFAFSCPGQSGKTYILATYNVNGVLQSNYEISSSQCSGAGGFAFTIDAPVTSRYYVSIASPTFTEATAFTQSDYSLVVALSNPSGGATTAGTTGTRVRKDGELEPNEDRVNAYPLTGGAIVTAQLATASDLDFYYVDNNVETNPLGVIPVYFKCDAGGGSATQYVLSAFNSAGLLQNSYTVTADQCSTGSTTTGTTTTTGSGPFRFEIPTPQTDRYYVAIGAPAATSGQTTSTAFSDGDYSLSLSANTGDNLAVSGNLRTAAIQDAAAANKDRFFFNLRNCGNRRGVIKLSGNKLNLTGIDLNTQIKVQIGPWSCLSDSKALTLDNSTGTPLYLYPKPVAATPKPRKRVNIGSN